MKKKHIVILVVLAVVGGVAFFLLRRRRMDPNGSPLDVRTNSTISPATSQAARPAGVSVPTPSTAQKFWEAGGSIVSGVDQLSGGAISNQLRSLTS